MNPPRKRHGAQTLVGADFNRNAHLAGTRGRRPELGPNDPRARCGSSARRDNLLMDGAVSKRLIGGNQTNAVFASKGAECADACSLHRSLVTRASGRCACFNHASASQLPGLGGQQ